MIIQNMSLNIKNKSWKLLICWFQITKSTRINQKNRNFPLKNQNTPKRFQLWLKLKKKTLSSRSSFKLNPTSSILFHRSQQRSKTSTNSKRAMSKKSTTKRKYRWLLNKKWNSTVTHDRSCFHKRILTPWTARRKRSCQGTKSKRIKLKE